MKMAVVRWMFHPRHLPADHSERSKARKGDAKKEVYLACDVNNTDMNKLVRAVCHGSPRGSQSEKGWNASSSGRS